VLTDVELPGIIADNHGVGQEAVRLDAAPQRSLVAISTGSGLTFRAEMPSFSRWRSRLPDRRTSGRDARQAGHHMRGQRAFAHVSQRLGIDDVIAMAGAQQREKVEAALRAGGAEPGEVRIANLRAEAVGALWRAPVSSTVIQAALMSPARSTSRASARKPS